MSDDIDLHRCARLVESFDEEGRRLTALQLYVYGRRDGCSQRVSGYNVTVPLNSPSGKHWF